MHNLLNASHGRLPGKARDLQHICARVQSILYDIMLIRHWCLTSRHMPEPLCWAYILYNVCKEVKIIP